MQQSNADSAGQARLIDRVSSARRRLFVGRHAERRGLKQLLSDDCARPIWFVSGPGGIGKTMLAFELVAGAGEAGVAAAIVDARRIAPNVHEARRALDQALERLAADDGRCPRTACGLRLLVIDTFECWQELSAWLREEWLATAPADLRLVLCGRCPPDADWQTDPGWQAVTHRIELQPLDPRAARRYLDQRGVPRARQAALMAFACGHPLALALSAEGAQDGARVDAPAAIGDDQIGLLVRRFVDEARSERERRALDSCAIARELNPSLLAFMLEEDDAAALYEWLRELSFVSLGAEGLYPHDLVRDALMRDMQTRTPGRYEALAERVPAWVVDYIVDTPGLTWERAAALAADAMYALRRLAVVQEFMNPAGTRSLYIDRPEPFEIAALRAITAGHEGEASARWFDYWAGRYPQTVFVVRDSQRSARGYFLKLDLESLGPRERESDPVIERLARCLEQDHGLKPGDHVPVVRFWMSASAHHEASPEKTVILMAINVYNLMAKNLRFTVQIFADDPAWVTQAAALNIHRLPNTDTLVGDRIWRAFAYDWQQEPPLTYYRRFARRCIEFAARVGAGLDTGVAGPAAPRIDRALLARATRQALKQFHRSDHLCDSPLLAAAYVVSRSNRGDDALARVGILKHWLERSVQQLADEEAGAEAARMIERTFLHAALSQKQLAAVFHMSYATYRRRLAEAVSALSERLWLDERQARRAGS